MAKFIRALSAKTEFAIVFVFVFAPLILISVATFLIMLVVAIPPIVLSDVDINSLVIQEIAVLLPIGAFLHVRGWTLEGIGFRPELAGTIIGVGLAAAVFIAYCLAWELADSVFVEATGNQLTDWFGTFIVLAPDLGLSTVILVSIVNPFFEETFVCGYLISFLKRKTSISTAINVGVIIRVLYHTYQGPAGILYMIVVGLAFGHWYVRTGRLWPLFVAHACLDVFGLWIWPAL